MYSIAKKWKITPQWARELWRRSRYGREIPVLKEAGRPGRELPDEEVAFILECEREFHLHPVALERKIMAAYDRHIPHNRLYAVLKEAGIGIILCCGRKLRWQREKGSAVFEADCDNCGTSYAMAMVEEDDEPEEINMEEAMGAGKIKEMRLVKDTPSAAPAS